MADQRIFTSTILDEDFTQFELTTQRKTSGIPHVSGTRQEQATEEESVRRVHRADPIIPLVLMLQYTCTAWMSEIAHENFSSSGIHHTVVSKKVTKK